ncbi:MAG: hypothetical protein ABEH43_02590, partial [Flavobacteriales bacterium]
MKDISSYLDKFKEMSAPGGVVKEIAAEVIEDVCGVKIKKNDISYQNNVIFINISGAPKNRIFIKK